MAFVLGFAFGFVFGVGAITLYTNKELRDKVKEKVVSLIGSK
jgi:hypothetical protein